MPRVLKKGKCNVCNEEYTLKDRKYKGTCSPICSMRITIRTAIAMAKMQGIPYREIYDGFTSELGFYLETHLNELLNGA